MTRSVTAAQAKASILRLLDEVAAGGEVEITRHGRPMARLVPATGPNALRASMSGVATSTAPDDDLFGTGQDWDVVL